MPAADNAFRLLGLSCHASQREIYAAASSLRRAIKLGVLKPPAHHLAWLGALNRTENDVRDALSRLSVPAQRIYERLFWFFDPQAAAATGALSVASLQASIARLRSGENPCAPHDIALLSLAALLRLDPALELADDWRRTYALWKDLIEGKEFWSQLMAADLKGDFEQATTFAEIGDLRERAWRLVTAPIADVAQDAIIGEDRALASRALAVLRGSGLPQALVDEYEQEILGTVEDEFEVLLHVAFSSFRHEVKSTQNVAERIETCWRAYGKFNEQVKPALKRIFELAGADSPVARRVFATAADALDELADGFETAFDHASRLKMLRRAWQLAPPDGASLLLIEEHLAGAGEAGERQPKTDAGYARQVSLALREPIAQPDLFTAYIQKEEAEKKLDRWGKGASKFIFLMMIAVFVGKCFNGLPGSRRAHQYPPMNLNIAMPRFTPMPTPDFKLSSLVEHVSVEELQARLKARTVTLLHVGAKGEYDTGHIPGALSMPEAELAARAKRLPKRRPVVLYCYCDEQEASARAAFDLRLLGFQNVAVLEGGYRAWRAAGLPVIPAGRGLVRYGSEN
ncbi:MAG TPA: rhodanese-like domain-containing protein [Pyrinomonadaceae bacterium]